jgi:predicted transport protein
VPPTWTCPRCSRTFRQANQRHACGVGDRTTLLKNKSPALVELYGRLETTVKRLGAVEIVTGDRYVLFRTTRIFADMTFMRDALRLVVHLRREVRAPCFFKVQRGTDGRVAHVTKVHSAKELRVVTPFLREAYMLARSEEASTG